MCIDCYDSAGECYRTQQTFMKNCSQCVYPDNNCIIQCEPVVCPSLPKNCDRMIPTSDGCCMTCEGICKHHEVMWSNHSNYFCNHILLQIQI